MSNEQATVPAYKSKTLWVSLLVALAPFVPPLQVLILANPEVASLIVGGVFAGLRLTTSKKVVVK